MRGPRSHPAFHVRGVTSLALFLPLAVALAPFLSVVQTVRRKDGRVAIGHEESVSRKLGFLLFFFKVKGFLPDTVSSSLFSDTLIFSLKVGKVMVTGPLLILFYFHSGKLQRWRRHWRPTPVLLPGNSHGRRSLEGCSPWGR